MTLINILLALWLQRHLGHSAPCQFNHYFLHWWQQGVSRYQAASGRFVMLILPALLLAWLSWWLPDVLQLVLDTLILMLCLGCRETRNHYRQYLAAKAREDEQGAFYYARQLGMTDKPPFNTPGRCLVWHHYRYFYAILFWYVVAGSAAVLLYALFRHASRQQDDALWHKGLFWLDYLPVRLAALGYALVGYFDQAIGVWLEKVRQHALPPARILIPVALAAEKPALDEQCGDEIHCLLRLARRNLMLLLVMTAMAILAGWLP